MNIGLFTDTYYPELNGVANSVYLLKQELEKRGHNVYVITTKTPGVTDDDERVFRVPSKAAPMVPERRIGMPYHPKIALKIHKMKLDIIHTNTEFGIGLFGRIMARELFIPVVHTYHTIYEDYTHYLKKYISSEKRAKQFARTYSKFSVRGAEELIVPTEKVATLMRHYGVKPDINIIPTGIDLSKFQEWDADDEKEKLKRSLGIPKGNKVVLSLGRVSEEKNIDEVMDYLDVYMAKHEDVTFLIVGDGPYKNSLERKARGLKYKKRMIFAGAKPWDEINHYYQIGDAFVSASTSETQGLTYIEALASGVPLVVRKDDCLDGVLLNGENGYEYEDVDSFAKGLDAVLYNQAGIDYRTNAINSVLKFSTEEFAAKVENIYYHVIKNHRNILMRMANKVAGKIGFVRTGTKPLGGQMAMRLGNSDMDASRIALNCDNFDRLSYHEALRVVDASLENGITMFCNSPTFGGGKCEEIFGQILSENKGMRQRMRIQTECGNYNGYYDLSKAYMVSSVDDSLKRLNVDCIDLLMLGKPDYLMEPDEVADTIAYLQKSGKVCQFGVSGFSIDQMKLLQASCKDSILLERLSCGFSMDADINKTMETIDYCKLQDITVQATGLTLPKDKQKVSDVIKRIAQEYGVSDEVIALAWGLRNPANMQILIDANSSEQVKDMCSAMNITLTRKEWYELFFTFSGNNTELNKVD
ncbi:MAG: glycosyltransferase [Lachnospiraceae bacterium]|jgi:1,2-diacylglycerol 3-alpha-glucosyltransferase|nr:glycosyltransferase [Lachnospiraceae bacterium]